MPVQAGTSTGTVKKYPYNSIMTRMGARTPLKMTTMITMGFQIRSMLALRAWSERPFLAKMKIKTGASTPQKTRTMTTMASWTSSMPALKLKQAHRLAYRDAV
jgi:hypothetical protein